MEEVSDHRNGDEIVELKGSIEKEIRNQIFKRRRGNGVEDFGHRGRSFQNLEHIPYQNRVQ